MATALCHVCEEELYEPNPGVDNWDDDDGFGGFIVREMECTNKKCPLFEKQQDWFFDFTRVDVDGDEIDVEELKKGEKHDKRKS